MLLLQVINNVHVYCSADMGLQFR